MEDSIILKMSKNKFNVTDGIEIVKAVSKTKVYYVFLSATELMINIKN